MEPLNYIQLREVSKAYSEKALFSQISLSISQGQKVALIARNGSGKTTLLNIIAGVDQPDTGQCTYMKGLRMAYLQQEPEFDPEMTVSQTLLSDDNERNRTIREYEEFIRDTADTGLDAAEREQRLQQLIERMDALQAWDYEYRVEQVLSRLDIGNMKARTEQLSGGQLKRLALARILIQETDFILLDEPTNHLDVEMIEWLEDHLSRQKTTLLMVTHDRYFLDAVCNQIVELEDGQLHTYRGNYANYLEKKQARQKADTAQAEKTANLLRKEREWMQRSPPARTTKSKARIQSVEKLEEKADKSREGSPGEIRMDMKRLGKKILELSGVSKSFDRLKVVDNFSYVFKRGERTGIVGPNGTGKSTLLNLITGAIMPEQGEISTGDTIHFGYYRQEGLQVDENKKVIEVITDIAERIRMGKDHWMSAPQFLRYFNFPNQMHNNRVEKLSGGEKRRLYLLTVLMKNPNFLILDEPTNDLDIPTLNLLEDYLLRFSGCLIIVSHDRYFIDRLVEHLFVFRAPGDIKDFPGNYTDYRNQRKTLGSSQKKAAQPTPATATHRSGPKEKTKLSYKEQKEFEALEAAIDSLESEKNLLLEKMNQGSLDASEITEASRRFQEIEQLLEKKGDRWLELSQWA